MSMNVSPIPMVSDRINQIRLATAEIINKDILPNEDKLSAWHSEATQESGSYPWTVCLVGDQKK